MFRYRDTSQNNFLPGNTFDEDPYYPWWMVYWLPAWPANYPQQSSELPAERKNERERVREWEQIRVMVSIYAHMIHNCSSSLPSASSLTVFNTLIWKICQDGMMSRSSPRVREGMEIARRKRRKKEEGRRKKEGEKGRKRKKRGNFLNWSPKGSKCL